jgi:hypothetical protein
MGRLYHDHLVMRDAGPQLSSSTRRRQPASPGSVTHIHFHDASPSPTMTRRDQGSAEALDPDLREIYRSLEREGAPATILRQILELQAGRNGGNNDQASGGGAPEEQQIAWPVRCVQHGETGEWRAEDSTGRPLRVDIDASGLILSPATETETDEQAELGIVRPPGAAGEVPQQERPAPAFPTQQDRQRARQQASDARDRRLLSPSGRLPEVGEPARLQALQRQLAQHYARR